MGTIKTLAAAGILTTMGAMAAQAATLTLANGSALAFGTGNYDSVCQGGVTTCYDPNGSAAGLTEDISAYDSFTPGPGLTLDTAAILTVTFLGFESGAQGYAFSLGGSEIISNYDVAGVSSYSALVGAGTLDFSFSSIVNGGTLAANNGTFYGSAALGFSALFNGGTSVYAFFDDSGANDDRDYDDMVVLLSVAPAPVPLPAGFLLLGTGLAGLGMARRLRKS